MSLYSILPPEIVDMIYLYTDFFTTITQAPNRAYVLKKLFDKDISRTYVRGNWYSVNRHRLSVGIILEKGCEASLRYFKKQRPNVTIDYKMFVYSKYREMDWSSERNLLLISVYQISEEQLKYYAHQYRRRTTWSITYPGIS